MRLFILFFVQLTFLFPLGLLADAAVVKVKRANVRSGPGTNHDVVFVYRKNSPLKVIEEKGTWVKVEDFEKDTGWISKKILSRKAKGAIVKVSNANVRKGPSLKDPVVFIAGYGVAFKVTDTKGDWYKIQHEDGDTGWVNAKLVYAP